MLISEPSESNEPSLYEQMGGETRIRDLVDRFYDEMELSPEFAPLRQMHGMDLSLVRDKLFWFLSGFSGGPNLFVEHYGHPRLRARHLPFSIGITERDMWLKCMAKALDSMDYPPKLLQRLTQQFFATADWMRNQSDDSGLIKRDLGSYSGRA